MLFNSQYIRLNLLWIFSSTHENSSDSCLHRLLFLLHVARLPSSRKDEEWCWFGFLKRPVFTVFFLRSHRSSGAQTQKLTLLCRQSFFLQHNLLLFDPERTNQFIRVLSVDIKSTSLRKRSWTQMKIPLKWLWTVVKTLRLRFDHILPRFVKLLLKTETSFKIPLHSFSLVKYTSI